MRRLVKNPVAYRYEHADGLMSTMLLMGGLVEDFNFAASLEGRSEPFSTQMYLPMPPRRTSLANFFSPLVNNMEAMFLTGKPTYPVERTLLTTGLTAAGVESLYRDQVRYDTPHLAVPYRPTEGINVLENLSHETPSEHTAKANRSRNHGLSLSLSRAAHRRPLPGRLSGQRAHGTGPT